jgi:UDP-glucose 4-epimerase
MCMTLSARRLTVVVTGSFGNIGTSTVQALRQRGDRVVAYDLPTRANQFVARARFRGGVDVVWGDVLDQDAIARAVENADAVVHLAALIPPRSERTPELTERVNVDGTRNVVAAVAKAKSRPRLVYASSLSVYGRTQDRPPPRTVLDPVNPADHYGQTKAAAEHVVSTSDVDWVVLRFGAVLPLRLPLFIDPLMFEVPLTDRIEFVHTRDVGFAVTRSCELAGLGGKTLNIGGGPGCQLYQRQVVSRSLDVLGIGMLPDEAFTTTPYHCDWLDTTESQRLLGFQQHTFEDYLTDLRRRYGWRRLFVRAAAPLIQRAMLRTSPYWREHRRSTDVAMT